MRLASRVRGFELAPRLDRDITVVATPWSLPAWMKTNGDLVGGRLIDEPRAHVTYAQYFVKFVQAYGDVRVPVHAVAPQNEAQNRNPRSYPGIDLAARQERKLAVAVDQPVGVGRPVVVVRGRPQRERRAGRRWRVAQGDRSFDHRLPGGALATIVWQDSAVLDDDGSTAWTSAAAQQPGQELTVSRRCGSRPR